ncbi:MAG: Do family serine endopeptidase [Verrucomicrobiota bacterium]
MKANRSLIGVSASLLILASGLVAVRFVSQAAEPPPRLHVDSTPINREPQTGNSYSPIIKRVAPSVVNIYSSRIVRQRLYNPFTADPFFRRFFGAQDDDSGREVTSRDNWLGSGMVVTPDGYILTANHVVEGADEIKVGIKNDSTIYSAKVIGMDPPTDVAILKIDAKDLPAVTLGDSDQLEVGDVVLAVGNPFGIGQTVTRGIISALGRSLSDPDDGRYHYQDFIQTDAAINQGNSGGALVDAEGRLIGINDAMISPSGASAGIGLAVPVNMARNVMEGFLSRGKVSRGYLGVGSQDIDPGLARGFGAPNADGALVTEVANASPAARGGLLPGDVIVAINGKEIASDDSLHVVISELAPGSKATVKVYRNGAPKSFVVTLTERPDPESNASQPAAKSDDNNVAPPRADALDGVEVQDLDRHLRLQLGAPPSVAGALVIRVSRTSNSFEAGLRRGDVIMEVNHQPVATAKEAESLCKAARTEQIVVKIWHPESGGEGRVRYLSVDNTKR